jgi:hypothetical protein
MGETGMGEVAGAGLPRLVVHIGSGKTGTSSIQETLRAGRQALQRQGIAYLGLMLEHAGPQRFPWQAANGSDAFFRSLEPAAAAAQAHEVLATALPALGARGITRAVWSNEWMFQRPASVLPALLRLREAGVQLEVVCYIRRIDGWLYSAYVQWGVKDKPNRGPIRTFRDWRKGKDFGFHRHVQTWADALGPDFRLRNFDASPDVVTDFLQDFAGSVALEPRRENETPYPALLAAWMVHNSGREEPVKPGRFTALARPSGVLHPPQGAAPLAAMLPNEADLAVARAEYREDTARLNDLLAAQGQPPLDTEGQLRDVMLPSDWEMQVLLLRMVLSLQEQVAELKAALAAKQE